jgi:hypothetical protein
MKLQIDNLDGAGPRDYTAAIDAAATPRITRKLNEPAELRFSLLLGPDLVVPQRGSRVLLGRTNGQDVFTGYVTANPEYEFLGWRHDGPFYRFNVVALSDEVQLDEKRLPARSPFVARSAGDALRQLTEDALPGAFDTNAVQDLDVLPAYFPDPQLKWSEHAAAIATRARASYRAMNGELMFAPIGATSHALSESDAKFTQQGLALKPLASIVNDITVVGDIEPQDYVRDYFVGDGLTTRFRLSQNPFNIYNRTVFNEEYTDAGPNATRWRVTDPGGVVSISAGKLQIAGGNGVDGATTVQFVEQVELGGAWILQHGDVVFTAASSGVLGGLYLGPVTTANCIAGFRVSPSGADSQIQAVVGGAAVGVALTTVPGHHYVLTTRVYSATIFREEQAFHAAAHPAGNAAGGAQIGANVRLILEVHDIDPTNPATLVSPSVVLYDNVISGAPAFCSYVLVSSPGLHCAIAFTRFLQAIDVEVRTALPGQPYRTRLVGPLSTGGECNVYSGPTLDFFSKYVPALNEQIEVRYRGYGRAMARVTNPVSIAGETRGLNDGVHGAVRHLKAPPARTIVDCEHAALAILDDDAAAGWSGRYQTWSDFLPGGAQDVFPGDGLNINVPSRSAVLQAVITEVAIALRDLTEDHSEYEIQFVDAAASRLAFEFEAAKTTLALTMLPVAIAEVGTTTLSDLTGAAITDVSSTTATMDAGTSPGSGGGIEVRWSDTGWGPNNDQNLAGRFTSQTCTLPRLGKTQDYYLRQFDGSTPPKYSRYSAALHVDYPY